MYLLTASGTNPAYSYTYDCMYFISFDGSSVSATKVSETDHAAGTMFLQFDVSGGAFRVRTANGESWAVSYKAF